MATSRVLKYFQTTTGVPLSGARIWLVPQANTYPTGALELTAHATRTGCYYRDGVEDGEYKIYIDPAGGTSPELFEEKLWIGESRVSKVLDNFDNNNNILPEGIADQTVTVVDIMNPIPSYLGQFGKDAAGNLYVAIALADICWKQITDTDKYLDKGGSNQVSASDLKATVTAKHDKNKDTILDQGGTNEISAETIKAKLHDKNKDQKLDEGGVNEVSAAMLKGKSAINDYLANKKHYSALYNTALSAYSTLDKDYILTDVGDYVEFEVKPITGISSNYGIVGKKTSPLNTGSYAGVLQTGFYVKYQTKETSDGFTLTTGNTTGKWNKFKLLVVATGLELFSNDISMGVKNTFIPGTSIFTVRNIGNNYNNEFANAEVGSLKIHSASSGDVDITNILASNMENFKVSLAPKEFQIDAINRSMLSSVSNNFSSYYGGNGQYTLLPKIYTLSADGDYVEFEVKITDYSSNRAMGIIGDTKQTGTNVGIYTNGLLYIRNSAGTWVAQESVQDIRNAFAKIKLLFNGGSLSVYINGVLKFTKASPGTLSINVLAAAYTVDQTTLMNFRNLVINSGASGYLNIPNPIMDENLIHYGGVSISNDGNGFLTQDQIQLLQSTYDPGEIVVIKTNGLIKIYCKGTNPASSKYLCYTLQLLVNAPTNANSWNLKTVIEVNRTGEYTFEPTALGEVIVTGEWESAIMIQGEVDFMGGHMHGDEILSIATMLVDGQEKDLTTSENMRCREVKFIQVSELRKPSTNTNVCDHFREHLFTAEGLKLKQKYNWKSVETLTMAYLAMCPVARINSSTNQITTKAYRDNDYIIDDVSVAGFTGGVSTEDANTVRKINIWGNVGIGIELEILKVEPTLNNNCFFVSNSSNYNKLYYNYVGVLLPHGTEIGEKWEIEAFYKIMTKN